MTSLRRILSPLVYRFRHSGQAWNSKCAAMKLADFDMTAAAVIGQQRRSIAARPPAAPGWRDGKLRDLAFSIASAGDARDGVLNETRVLKPLYGASQRGRVELFVERILGEPSAGLMRAAIDEGGRSTQVGDGVAVEVLGREEDFYRVRFAEPVAAVLERCGSVPLPPYITHVPGQEDAERYQTVYARNPGAVAAPTAGLHFDQEILRKIQDNGTSIANVTLHVGAVTLHPCAPDIEDHAA